ncbi:U3 small nucleolar RNA-associated protein 14 homolog A [Spea bombifrons]|uniref:U3 small nucleolar RNA-associated protein 14 homolog A n=1 Tax=Spea bombifrons TaxID=233779 RepID=UPI00234B73BF|nr:U3 small nucleolar RNA-associated protein 14 homolog A [Spea bombifrons]
MSAAKNGGGALLLGSKMDEEEDLFVKEYAVSASEDEGDSVTERKHQKLLDAITSLDGKKRRRVAERSEASLQVSEFGISSEGTGEKLTLSDLIEPTQKSASLSTVRKQLKKLSRAQNVEVPLTKEETQKIQRVVAYEKASEEVTRWEHIVKQNRKADQLVFAENDDTVKPARIEDVVTGWKARTSLEMEIFNILHENKQPLTDPLLTPVEEASLKAMSLEEAKLRRAELQKARALQSYYESKARREKKIKSKKYHKMLKKSRHKEALKVFEELKNTNPEAALEELQKIERARMEERMSLKHQNSGKWAKSKAIMAKYDDEARKAMQEQLQKNKDLTRKVQVISESEESGEEEVIPDFVNDAQLNPDGLNPWMTGKLSREAKESGNQAADVDVETEENKQSLDQDEEDDPEDVRSEEEVLLQEFEEKRRLRKNQDDSAVIQPVVACDIVNEPEDEQVSAFKHLFQKLLDQNNHESRKRKSTFQEPEKPEVVVPQEETEEEGPLLTEGLERRQTIEEIGALAQEEHQDVQVAESVPRSNNQPGDRTSATVKEIEAKRPKLIDHNDVLPVAAQKIQIPVLPTTVEEEEEENDDTDQKMIIKEAFAGDDVIRDFLKEKRDAEKEDKPKDINLILPGWGEWGGTNLKPSKKKRRKFIIKARPAPPRKDQCLPNVIMNEKRNIIAAAHQVNELPFPFNSRQHFESTIRAPVGNTWNTERSVQKLTAPRVITKRGHIIEPMTEEVLKKNGSSKKPAIELNKPHSKHTSHKGTKQRKKK